MTRKVWMAVGFWMVTARAGAQETFVPSADLSLGVLARMARARSANVRVDALSAETAKADVRQAGLLGNPTLDATWGTLPLGATNPADLKDPWVSVPNYSVGVSYTFPIGKRGPTIARAAAAADVAAFTAKDTLRHSTAQVARAIAAVGVAQLRAHGLREEVTDQKEALVLAKSRVSAGFGAPLDIDRLAIEVERVEQQAAAADADTEGALSVCASLLRTPCSRFATVESVRAFMQRWVAEVLARAHRVGSAEIGKRPDVRALNALGRMADADQDLASAKVIPDPTVRVGYMRDQFVVSGAQQNSLSVSVSLPIPVFDHGQAAAQGASSRKQGYDALHALALAHAGERYTMLLQAVENRVRRREAIENVTLPNAERVIESLAKSAADRLIPLTDVIQARRTYAELLLQEADSYGDAFEASLALIEETFADVNEDAR